MCEPIQGYSPDQLFDVFMAPEFGGALRALLKDQISGFLSGDLCLSEARRDSRVIMENASIDPFFFEHNWLTVFFETIRSYRYGWLHALDGNAPGALAAFPAQELIRVSSRKEPRLWETRWSGAGGRLYSGRMIALKGDPVWTTISRFETPWPPFDFGSGMDVQDIPREEAIALGVIKESDRLPRPVKLPDPAFDF